MPNKIQTDNVNTRVTYIYIFYLPMDPPGDKPSFKKPRTSGFSIQIKISDTLSSFCIADVPDMTTAFRYKSKDPSQH